MLARNQLHLTGHSVTTALTIFIAFSGNRTYHEAPKESVIHFSSVTSDQDCKKMLQLSCWLAVIAGSSSTLLFLLRANSVFFDSRWARSAFTLLWVISSISMVSLPFSFSGGHSEVAGCCMIVSFDKPGTIPSMTIGVFDVAVFLSVSYRIITQDPMSSLEEKIITFLTGKGLGQVSKLLLRTGQLYAMSVFQ